MSAEIKKPISVEEYFQICEESDEKFQFFNGEIFAMFGGTMNHSLISNNVSSELRNVLKDKPCRVFGSNLRIAVDKNDSYTYPDTSVICGEIQKNEKSQWVLEEFSELDEFLNLNSIESKIQVKEIYEKVEF
ncbi:MAG: Uma2 family endonuclease [Calditrichaeota bacterium]|nr:MAG: Uma2 family endonuclease [Calditrichota bacterium]